MECRAAWRKSSYKNNQTLVLSVEWKSHVKVLVITFGWFAQIDGIFIYKFYIIHEHIKSSTQQKLVILQD